MSFIFSGFISIAMKGARITLSLVRPNTRQRCENEHGYGHAHQPKQEISQAQNATSPKAIKLTLLINSERTHPPIHRLTILSRHCHRLSRTHSRTSDSAKCERLSGRSHALTIPALSKESCIEDMLPDFAEILMPHYAPASSFFISLY